MNGRPRLSAAQTRALKVSEVCACEARPAGEESGMVVCWVCAMPVVRVVDDGVDPDHVRWCMAEAGCRVLKEETERAATVVRNQEEETA